ncbi:hypothetical protein JKP88DRAFT_255827, partial [Tribonema minus]
MWSMASSTAAAAAAVLLLHHDAAGTAAAAAVAPGLPLEVRPYGSAPAGAYCGGAIETGQDVGMCLQVGAEYMLGSGADLLLAARFAGFGGTAAGGGGAPSTEPNLPSLVADVSVSLTETYTRMDAYKTITGSAQVRFSTATSLLLTTGIPLPTPRLNHQVDMLMCSDAACTVVADLALVVPAGAPDAPPTLASGYMRLPDTLLGLPVRFLSPRARSVALPPAAADTLSASDSAASPPDALHLQRYAWEIPDDSVWVDAFPLVLPFDALVRMYGAVGAGAGVDAIRVGVYVDARGACVRVYWPRHPWMESMGWGVSADCAPTEAYIFDSAYLDWETAVPLPDALAPPPYTSDIDWTGRDTLFNLAPEWDTGGWEAAAAAATYGRCLACLDPVSGSAPADATGGANCFGSFQSYCAADPGGRPEFPQFAGRAAALRIGGASVVAWNLTEPGGVPPPGPDGHIAPADPQRYNPNNPAGAAELSAATWAFKMMFKLPILSARAGPLPWCSEGEGLQLSVQGEREARRGFVQLPGGGGIASLYDCAGAWVQLGWGNVWGAGAAAAADAAGVKRLPSADGTGAVETMQPSWANVTAHTGPVSSGIGFAGYNHISAYVIESGISVVATAAVAQLTLATSLQLSAADESATTAGVVLNLSLTVLALMSTYIGRREMQSFFRKGMRPRPAVVMTMVVTIFASATAALMLLVEELSARASNPNGAQSLVRWLHGDAGGYLIVGVTAMRFEARYSEAA